MKTEPIDNTTTFTNKRFFERIIRTSYGKCIHGTSKEYSYDVYVAEDKKTKNIVHKLYYITKDNKWVRSVLRLFSGNKLSKEIRSVNKDGI